ncbi:MAG: hypothetical protein LC768_10825 [Acidobacteria bacterium]|nr:hypothetical protein [Acidobacteriota bacterium]
MHQFSMEKETKLALFVGGSVDGQIMEVAKIESRLYWYGSYYNSRGMLETKQYGTVLIYVLDSMKSEEERQRLKVIKKVL